MVWCCTFNIRLWKFNLFFQKARKGTAVFVTSVLASLLNSGGCPLSAHQHTQFENHYHGLPLLLLSAAPFGDSHSRSSSSSITPTLCIYSFHVLCVFFVHYIDCPSRSLWYTHFRCSVWLNGHKRGCEHNWFSLLPVLAVR